MNINNSQILLVIKDSAFVWNSRSCKIRPLRNKNAQWHSIPLPYFFYGPQFFQVTNILQCCMFLQNVGVNSQHDKYNLENWNQNISLPLQAFCYKIDDYLNAEWHKCYNTGAKYSLRKPLNTFTAKDDYSRFKYSCVRLPKTTIVDLFFQSRSFSLKSADLSL
jgi:hypothetical protein